MSSLQDLTNIIIGVFFYSPTPIVTASGAQRSQRVLQRAEIKSSSWVKSGN